MQEKKVGIEKIISNKCFLPSFKLWKHVPFFSTLHMWHEVVLDVWEYLIKQAASRKNALPYTRYMKNHDHILDDIAHLRGQTFASLQIPSSLHLVSTGQSFELVTDWVSHTTINEVLILHVM